MQGSAREAVIIPCPSYLDVLYHPQYLIKIGPATLGSWILLILIRIIEKFKFVLSDSSLLEKQ